MIKNNLLPETDVKELKGIYTERPQYRRFANTELRPVYGLDTETHNGNIFLIADSDGRYLDKINTCSVIDFLFESKFENAWNFFWNLEYDAGVILKLLGSQLLSYMHTRRLSFKYGEYTIDYLPKRCLRISKKHHSTVFYDIAQFYQSSLVYAYEKNIQPVSAEVKWLKGKRAEFSARFYRRNTTLVRNYCINDCIMAKALASKWITLFHKAFDFYPIRFISPGYLAEKVAINRQFAFPLFNQVLSEIQEFAYRSYFGGRFEMLKRGFIGQAWLYDINSAYPDKISKLPDLTDGEWISEKCIQSKAKVGFFKIQASIPDDRHLSPLPFRTNHILLFPSGKFITYATLDELKTCKKDYYEILESWQFIPNSNYLPYWEDIHELYNRRQELKGTPLELPFKLIINSLYGKTGEIIRNGRSKKIGNLFNPAIFSHITGSTRAQIYRFIMERGLDKYVVGIATDSIMTTTPLNIDSSKLGEFSFKKSGDDVYYLQNGIYRIGGRWSSRGFGKLCGNRIENTETFEHNGKLYLRLHVQRNTQVRSGIIQNRISDIGKIRPVTREVNLSADRKRLWLGRLQSINAFTQNDSMPLSLNYFNKQDI